MLTIFVGEVNNNGWNQLQWLYKRLNPLSPLYPNACGHLDKVDNKNWSSRYERNYNPVRWVDISVGLEFELRLDHLWNSKLCSKVDSSHFSGELSHSFSELGRQFTSFIWHPIGLRNNTLDLAPLNTKDFENTNTLLTVGNQSSPNKCARNGTSCFMFELMLPSID